MYPEELRISYSRSLWSTEPVPRWTGEPHRTSSMPAAALSGAGSETVWDPRNVLLKCLPFSGPNGQREREPGGARGEGAESLYPFSLHRIWELQVPWTNFLAGGKV